MILMRVFPRGQESTVQKEDIATTPQLWWNTKHAKFPVLSLPDPHIVFGCFRNVFFPPGINWWNFEASDPLVVCDWDRGSRYIYTLRDSWRNSTYTTRTSHCITAILQPYFLILFDGFADLPQIFVNSGTPWDGVVNNLIDRMLEV